MHDALHDLHQWDDLSHDKREGIAHQLARQFHGIDYIGCALALRDDRRPLVDETVVHSSGGLVRRIGRLKHLSREGLA
jgi:hypothetical protein